MKRGRRGLNLDYFALHARYIAGESGVAIAAELGINFSGLYRSWQRRGLPMRSGSDAALLIHEQRPDLGQTILVAQAARRGAHDPMARREQRAQTREARGIGISENERRLAEALRAHGIVFRQQAAVGPYNADFLFPEHGVALEIDGGGHNPRVRAGRQERDAFFAAQGWTIHHIATRRADWMARALRLVDH